MVKRRVVQAGVIGVASAGIVSLAAMSIVGGLRQMLGRMKGPQEGERERVRRSLTGSIVTLDPAIWGDWLRPLPQDFDWAAFRARMPKLDPPLSQTIIEERESAER